MGDSPQGRKQLEMTYRLNNNTGWCGRDTNPGCSIEDLNKFSKGLLSRINKNYYKSVTKRQKKKSIFLKGQRTENRHFSKAGGPEPPGSNA